MLPGARQRNQKLPKLQEGTEEREGAKGRRVLASVATWAGTRRF